MTYNNFLQIEDFKLPKIVHLKYINRELLYFGTNHSNSIKDKLFAIIEKKISDFRPNFIFHEGNSDWPIFKDRDSTISISGESGHIIQLAKENNIEYETIESDESSEYQYPLKKYDLS